MVQLHSAHPPANVVSSSSGRQPLGRVRIAVIKFDWDRRNRKIRETVVIQRCRWCIHRCRDRGGRKAQVDGWHLDRTTIRGGRERLCVRSRTTPNRVNMMRGCDSRDRFDNPRKKCGMNSKGLQVAMMAFESKKLSCGEAVVSATSCVSVAVFVVCNHHQPKELPEIQENVTQNNVNTLDSTAPQHKTQGIPPLTQHYSLRLGGAQQKRRLLLAGYSLTEKTPVVSRCFEPCMAVIGESTPHPHTSKYEWG